MTKLILDVDTGTDDAVAIMTAALHPELELVGITTVNGNVPVAYCTENTLRVLDHISAKVPVHEGATRPMVRPDFPIPRSQRDRGASMHGLFLDLPESRTSKESGRAVDYLIEYFMSDEGPDTVLVPTGPLTNIAMALTLEPAIIKRIPRVVLMGGGHEIGNVSASAEFNIWADPEAAKVVFSSGVREIVVVPLDCTHEAVVSAEDCSRFDQIGTPASLAASSFVSRRIRAHDESQQLAVAHTAPVHDAVCVNYLVNPAVLRKTGRYFVDVETSAELCVGRTVIDTHRRSGREPNALVALGGDKQIFVNFLTETLSRTL
jgi:inosine-uridine nucleoside N-ribohydrolase